MTRATARAVEDVLDRRIDVRADRAARNLHAVGERRDRAVCPARSAILRQMLIARHGTVRLAVGVLAPGEIRRSGLDRREAFVRRFKCRVAAVNETRRLGLLAVKHFAVPRRDGGSQDGREEERDLHSCVLWWTVCGTEQKRAPTEEQRKIGCQQYRLRESGNDGSSSGR